MDLAHGDAATVPAGQMGQPRKHHYTPFIPSHFVALDERFQLYNQKEDRIIVSLKIFCNKKSIHKCLCDNNKLLSDGKDSHSHLA